MDTAKRLESGLNVAGQQVALMILNLAEKTSCVPTLWAFDGEQVKMTYLVAGNSDRAEEMARATIAKDYADHHSVSTVMDVYLRDPRTHERTDALQVKVQLPGTEVELVLALPYDAAGPTFDRGFQLLGKRGVPDEIDLERIRAALFGNIERASAAEPGSVLEKLPRTVAADLLGFGESAGAAAPAGPTGALLRLASLAPLAGFLLVASADGKVEASEVEAFRKALDGCKDPLIGRMLAASPVAPMDAVKRLAAEPPLGARAIAAAGAVMAADPAGADAREAFLEMMRAVARRDGHAVGTREQEVLDVIAGVLAAGEQAAAGPDPFADLAGQTLDVLLAEASLALFAGFVVVAAADGKVEPGEVSAFLEGLGRIEHPLLKAMLVAGGVPPDQRIGLLLADQSRVRTSLRAAGRLFGVHATGDGARAEFMSVMRSIAAADGVVTEDEQRVLRRVELLLDDKAVAGVARARVALMGGLLLAVVVAVWQVTSAALALPASWFVPVACTLELLVLLPMLALTAVAGARYVQQIVLGTFASLVGAVFIALTSIVVTGVLFPSVLLETGGTVLGGALGGFVGTAGTGLVLSALLGIVIRSRS